MSVVFSPDNSGRFFFTEKNNGRVRIYEDNALRPKPFVTIPVTGSGEQGLLGITLHPQYPDSPFVYAFFVRSAATGGMRDNLVVRFRDSSDVGVNPDTILIVPRRNSASGNVGGNLHFGPDDKLYVTVGDHATPSNSQDLRGTNLRGKILRLNADGSIPSDNPFPRKPFWSIGHRNSFDFTFDPQTGHMYCTDGGPTCTYEVNRVPPGGNLGWPVDGNCTYGGDPAYVRPLYYFSGQSAPVLTGVAVYRGTAFPRLRGKLLFTGSNNPNLWTLTLNANGDTIVPGSFSKFITYGGGFSDVELGPDGCIYLTSGSNSSAKIVRVSPIVPAFISTPLMNATQDSLYFYTPSFSGTPPVLSVLSGPDGMYVDSSTWAVKWKPTNSQALQGLWSAILRAENGAGTVDQAYSINVTNVNDVPNPFLLTAPHHDTSLSFVGGVPTITFAWENTGDPDGDTLNYTLEIDTVSSFKNPVTHEKLIGTSTSVTLTLPRMSSEYFWRVKGSDGELSTTSSEFRRVVVSFVVPQSEQREEAQESGLEQNFPNPFNPNTKITYTIPKSGPVRLAVFNLLGQEVTLIFEGYQHAGTHEIEFNSSSLPTGIYFYRIQASDFVETKKMIIAK